MRVDEWTSESDQQNEQSHETEHDAEQPAIKSLNIFAMTLGLCGGEKRAVLEPWTEKAKERTDQSAEKPDQARAFGNGATFGRGCADGRGFGRS